jgi:hypothetical protein
VLLAVALAAGCGDAARGLSSGPGGAAAAVDLVDALRARYGKIEREPRFEALRPKLSGALLVPSRVFDDTSVWTAAEGDWRALWLEGRGRPGAYRLGVRPAPALPQAPGECRARIALRRRESGRFEWSTLEELALGPLTPPDLSAAFRALLRAAEAEAGRDARRHVASAMPRAGRAFGRLFDLEALASSPEAGGTLRVELALRLQPERLKPEAPKFAAYVARYSSGLRVKLVALVPDGRPLWSAEIEETAWRLRMRARDGSLVPLEGWPGHEAGGLRVMVDYSFKAGLFRVGVGGLAVDVEPAPRAGQLAFDARFDEQPDWQLPFLIEPFMRGSLRYPFEGEGSQFSLAVREEPGRGSLLVTDSRVRIRESWIVRWLGGFAGRALADLRAAEAEADRYVLECLTAVREDVAALVGTARKGTSGPPGAEPKRTD